MSNLTVYASFDGAKLYLASEADAELTRLKAALRWLHAEWQEVTCCRGYEPPPIPDEFVSLIAEAQESKND